MYMYYLYIYVYIRIQGLGLRFRSILRVILTAIYNHPISYRVGAIPNLHFTTVPRLEPGDQPSRLGPTEVEVQVSRV